MGSSHQTIRLSRGSHSSAEEGACVMELASMLAGEPFSDRPTCACPVIGAFLRTYNDGVDDERRQTLYCWASSLVGTRATPAIERARAEVCARWTRRILDEERRFHWGRWRVIRESWRVDGHLPTGSARAAGQVAALLSRDDGDLGHARVLVLLDRLVALSADRAFPAMQPEAREPSSSGVRG